MLEKLRENAETVQHVTPGRVKTCMYNSFDVNSPWGENLTPVKAAGVSSPRGNFFFSFLVANTGRGLTTHRVEFNLGRNSPQGEILVVNRPLLSSEYVFSHYWVAM